MDSPSSSEIQFYSNFFNRSTMEMDNQSGDEGLSLGDSPQHMTHEDILLSQGPRIENNENDGDEICTFYVGNDEDMNDDVESEEGVNVHDDFEDDVDKKLYPLSVVREAEEAEAVPKDSSEEEMSQVQIGGRSPPTAHTAIVKNEDMPEGSVSKTPKTACVNMGIRPSTSTTVATICTSSEGTKLYWGLQQCTMMASKESDDNKENKRPYEVLFWIPLVRAPETSDEQQQQESAITLDISNSSQSSSSGISYFSSSQSSSSSGSSSTSVATSLVPQIVTDSGPLNLKSFKCFYCEKCFNQRAMRNRHHVVHEGGQFICGVDGCTVAFRYPSSLTIHRKKYHGVDRPRKEKRNQKKK